MNNIIQDINLYKARSADKLKSQQTAYIPVVNNDQIECTVQSYIMGNRRYPVNPFDQVCFKLRYIELFPSVKIKDLHQYQHSKDIVTKLIINKIIRPFMLFINGYMIPWGIIDISLCEEEIYLTVNSSKNYNFFSLTRSVIYANIVSLPLYTLFSSRIPAGSQPMFTFDSNGLYTSDESKIVYYFYPSPDAINKHITYKTWSMGTNPVNALQIFDDASIKLSSENVILFENGRLVSGKIDRIKKSFEREYIDEDTGRTNTHLDIVKDATPLAIKAPEVRFDSTLLTINNGIPSTTRYDFVVFANYQYTPSADNISKIQPNTISDFIKAENSGNSVPVYYPDLKIPFELNMDRSKKYEENVKNAINSMMRYNSSFFNRALFKNANLEMWEYDLEWLMSRVDDEGMLYIPRRHNEMIEEYLLLLINGALYKYDHMARYRGNNYLVPIQGIEYGDTVELLRFKNVNNNVFDITINSDDGFVYYSSDIVNEDMLLFSTETDTTYFEFPSDGLQHFPVEYSLEKGENDTIKVTLTNPFYYGKPLKIAYKNRYQHFGFILNQTTDKYTVNLGNKFMYCNDYSKYMVFHNGRRLGSDLYRLTLPVRPTTPFSTFEIYLALPVREGDVLDVIYTPSLIQDIVMKPEIPLTGDIVIDKSVLNYGLSVDLYAVWVNGKKIPKSHIVDLDSEHMRIITDEKSIKNVCITKFIPEIDEITRAFKDNDSLWDNILNSMSNSDKYKLIGINAQSLTDTEENIYSGSVNIKSIMYELIREQYVMNPRVDISGPFIYDYQDVDNTAINGYDAGGNAILPVMDANREDNLDNVSRPWP